MMWGGDNSIKLHARPRLTSDDVHRETHNEIFTGAAASYFPRISNCHLEPPRGERTGFVQRNFSASPESSRSLSKRHLPRMGLYTALLSFVNLQNGHSDGSRFSNTRDSIPFSHHMSTHILLVFANFYLVDRLIIRFCLNYREQRTEIRASIGIQITAG